MSTDNSLSADGSGPPVALIAGPTASGKSDLAVRLAREIARRGGRGVVVNADSAQVYADLAVLSARPSAADMGGIEHRLYGAWDGAMACSAADWAGAARAEIADLHAAGAIPILVGGTGLYLRTLLDGIAPVPAIPPETRAAVRALPVAEAHAALRREDPERAARLHPTDTARVARALEVVRATGRTLASWQAERVGGIGGAVHLFPAILLPPRDWLYPRCDTRFAAMVDGGAMGEVEALLARRLDPALPVMRAIGVPEIAAFLRGELGRDAAIAAGAQATRNYVKRQFTWLRHQPPSRWPGIESETFDADTLFESLFLKCGLT